MAGVTESELIAAILAACGSGPDDSEALTTQQLMERTGHGDRWVHAQLRKLAAQGRLVHVRVTTNRIDGAATIVPAYKLKAG